MAETSPPPIRALHAGGRGADALEQYLYTKNLLVEELG